MLTNNLLPALLLTTSALASLSPAILRVDDVLSKPYAARIAPILSPRDASSSSSSSSSANTTTAEPFANATAAACAAALRGLSRSGSASGTSICFNLPSLDVRSGAFEADLRLYAVSPPRGRFADVELAHVRVEAYFAGATVSRAADARGPAAAGSNETDKILSRALSTEVRLLQDYSLVGQINKNEMRPNMSLSALQALLMPTLTLRATLSNGTSVSANVTGNEASFLTGMLSHQAALSDFAVASAAVASEVASLKRGDVAFVLPGTSFMIFPVGLVITGTWAVAGILVYGLGTLERKGHAKGFQKKRRDVLRWGRTRRV